MGGKCVTEWRRRPLVEKDSHSMCPTLSTHRLCLDKALAGMFENGLYLLAPYPREPFEKLHHRRPAFEVLEQRAHRHARILEHPCAADLPRHALHRLTVAPIEHQKSLGRP